MKEVVFLLEAFLGTEVVLEALVARCRHALEDPKAWGKVKFDIDHHNSHWRRIIHALGWLRLRTPKARCKALVAPLAKPNEKLPVYSETLARLSDDSMAVGDDEYALDFAAQRRDPAPIRAHLTRWPRTWAHAEMVYVLGRRPSRRSATA
jgi:hypothetical protein